MTSEKKCIHRFIGKRGRLFKADEKVTNLLNVVIEKYEAYMRSPDGGSDIPYHHWVAISFYNIGPNYSIFNDRVSDTNTITEYELLTVGKLDDGTPKVAKVSGVHLESSTRGIGREVTFSNQRQS